MINSWPAFGGHVVRTPQELGFVSLTPSQLEERGQAALKPGKINEQEVRPPDRQHSLPPLAFPPLPHTFHLVLRANQFSWKQCHPVQWIQTTGKFYLTIAIRFITKKCLRNVCISRICQWDIKSGDQIRKLCAQAVKFLQMYPVWFL